MLYPGLYEQVINNALNRELAEIPEARKSTAPIDTAEAVFNSLCHLCISKCCCKEFS